MKKIIYTILLLAFLGNACAMPKDKEKQIPKPDPEAQTAMPENQAKQIIELKSQGLVEAIKNKNIDFVANLAHPQKGLLFSPYVYIGENAVILKAGNLASEYKSSKKYLWGHLDGSGEPINLTVKEYFNKNIFSDFSQFKEVSYNRIIGKGNSFNNIFEYFPKGIVVEYYNPGTNPEFEGMDWESIRFVFEQYEEVWYLVAIVNDQWTI